MVISRAARAAAATGGGSSLNVFFDEVSPNDRVGLMTFSELVKPRKPIATSARNEHALRSLVSNLVPEGGTAVYDATAAGAKAVRKLDDSSRINAVVVLTDGEDTDSALRAGDVVRLLANQPDSGPHVRVFTIAYSSEAAGSKQSLRRISQASGGQDYTGTVDNIEDVYRSISSFF